MITITLNKIKAHDPCQEGWDAILARTDLHGGDYGREFPLAAVLDTDRPMDAVWAMRCLPEHDQRWRLFAVRCARRVQHIMTDQRSLDALDVAERHANGQATDEELAATSAAASAAAMAATSAAASAAAMAAAWDARAAMAATSAAAMAAAWDARAAIAATSAAAWDAAWDAARAAAWDAAMAAEENAQIEILRELLAAAQEGKP